MKNKLIEFIKNNEYTCVCCDDENFVYMESGVGVKPIITPMKLDKEYFKDKYVGDKIVGRAAALLLALSGAKYVYGEVMSRGAIEILQKYNIEFDYNNLVDYIENRTHSGMCPLEECVKTCSDKILAYDIIANKIEMLMSANNQK